MASNFVDKKEFKTLPNSCATCTWSALPAYKNGFISKEKAGHCQFPVPPLPFFLSGSIVTTMQNYGIWWNSGIQCYAWTKKP
jgi:hypothetical protein